MKFSIRNLEFIILAFMFCIIQSIAAIAKVEAKKKSQMESAPTTTTREALYWEKLENGMVKCHLCPHGCVLRPGERGFCRARENKGGTLVTLNYSLPCAVHIDPMEKKPLFHFLPGAPVFSIATAGCNFRCKFCQNWEIAQRSPQETKNVWLPPEDVVSLTKRSNCPAIAYTYSEPVNFYEYMIETARLAHAAGIKNVMHSNGFINPEPLRELCKYLDAANIDLKGFTNEFYQEVCSGRLEPVLRSLKILQEEGVWLEITNLIIPTKNDDPKTIRRMCEWIRDNLGTDVPIHFSRFWPMYKLKNLPPTPIETLEKAREIALSVGLKYVYIGNIPGHEAENTYCPRCKKLLVRRIGYHVTENNIVNGRCKFCGYKIPGVWK